MLTPLLLADAVVKEDAETDAVKDRALLSPSGGSGRGARLPRARHDYKDSQPTAMPAYTHEPSYYGSQTPRSYKSPDVEDRRERR